MDDFDDFVRRLHEPGSELAQFFQTGNEIVIARAPGRLDIMGGVADYSGSLVAEATIGAATFAAIQRRPDKVVKVWSRGIDSLGLKACFEVSVDRLIEAGLNDDLVGLRNWTLESEGISWAGYILGCFAVLARERLLHAPVDGANIVLESAVPIGAGLSSSAAVEVATMMAVCEAYGVSIEPEHLASLAQVVENEVVGVPCGIMDQMTCALGHVDRLLLLQCRPHTIQGYQQLPDGVRVYGIHSGVSHSVGGRPYGRARAAAFMGKRLINDRRVIVGDQPVGYLTELSPAKYRREYRAMLPSNLKGADFLATAGSTGDTVTTIDAETIYPVRSAVEHAVYENQRAVEFIACLDEAAAGRGSHRALAIMRAGELMYGSHWSYTRIGLGCRETTLLVRLAREAGLAKGIYGARVTGGGSGGTVAILCDGDESDKVVAQIADAYRNQTTITPTIVPSGISPGAGPFGAHRITLQ